MDNGICFAQLDGSPEAEWTAVRDYFAYWHDCPIAEPPANLPAEFATTSAAILEWTRLVQGLKDAQREAVLRDDIAIENVPGHDAIGFLWQSEGDFIWAIDKAHWNADNPEVLGFVLDYDAAETVFIPTGPVATSLSEFALTHSSFFLHRTFAHACVNALQDQEWLKGMKAGFSVNTQLGKTVIFESPGVIALIIPDSFDPDRSDLKVALKHPDGLKQCPNTCLDLLKNGGSFGGYFGVDAFRKSTPKRPTKPNEKAKPFWKIW